MHNTRVKYIAWLLLFSPIWALGDRAVTFKRAGNQVHMVLDRQFGVQKDSKHLLIVKSADSGKTLKELRNFSGITAQKDNKYFSELSPFTIPQSGKLRLEGKIFYCHFEQKYCSVQRINEDL